MSFLAWMALAGGLLLLMALSSAYLRRLPVTSSGIYLALGLAVSPAWLDLIRIDFMEHRVVLEHLTEVAVIISLFMGGLKLRLPWRDPAWSAAYRLAGPVMLLSIAGVAALGHYGMGLSWPASFLLGAVLAPTDPVLAGLVAVNHAGDHDRMRYGLSGEAGFNDGAAFPFVVLSLMWLEAGSLGSWTGGWALHRLVWAVPAGLAIGYVLGVGVARWGIKIRSREGDNEAPNDFLALALIALSYAAAEAVGAWGFLAAFAAGLGFRRAEVAVHAEGKKEDSRPAISLIAEPAERDAGHFTGTEEIQDPATAAGVVVAEVLSFGETAERLLEVMMVVIVGICLASAWDWRAVPLALALFIVIRPAAVFCCLAGSPTGFVQRAGMAWFGIRGIGSLYYLSYALNHGLTESAQDLTRLTISTVALSVVIHGISSQPILDYYERKWEQEKPAE